MVYDKNPKTYGDGQWHCPFPREWVERMKHAARVCQGLTSEQIEAAYSREVTHYRLPPGDFLEEPQDTRGLPVGYGDGLGRNVSCDIYDYDSIPDVVVTNGHDDRAYKVKSRVLTA